MRVLGSAMFTSTFNLVTQLCRTTVIFGKQKDGFFLFIFKHQTIAFVTGTSSKMASTLC